jgi:hypothetical protein
MQRYKKYERHGNITSPNLKNSIVTNTNVREVDEIQTKNFLKNDFRNDQWN